ncbi:hypothetical protein RhiirA5_411821 [Rhizophagus irregularis]|uniref:Protein kinase domain-containing protein n=1 Tax=Rhizophagus irregularis TaxID=588596 RepID=A0A2I1DVB6_9GLOM|nr:hypothetical protein RhiirA5_411821 [Rhizophagus irregularis]PKC71492.1 hypothetical protein RhiirA1_453405 [Rhizophagus irregularis]PKY13818.1 hypothetical protein RhiirB3_425707 [Rhizophagus irregularis]GET53569.1 kinase-like domain-containing protein [Rhizophagus irregularis DAOM 181602=DAOM 197198]
MSGSLKYFQYHRFLRDLLIIQKSFGFQKPLQSKSPPVLKIYTYIACQLCKDFYSSQFLKLISESNIQSKSKRRRRNSFSDSLNSNKNLFSTSSHDQNFCFKYFKFKILGRGKQQRGLCALKAIHDKGVLHSDIREENILLAGDDVYIIDFGIASYDAEINTKKREKIGQFVFK